MRKLPALIVATTVLAAVALPPSAAPPALQAHIKTPTAKGWSVLGPGQFRK
jgi:hypothetical protein